MPLFYFTLICYTLSMIITYLGKQFFKIQQGDLVVAFNPISRESKSADKASKFGSKIAISTTNHPDYNGFENVTHGETVPFEISGPGDYEVDGIFIKGIESETILDGKKYINTIYSLRIENISICFLGPINNDKISSEARGEIDAPDIVFVPIAGGDMLDPVKAYNLALSFDSALVIPMDGDEKTLKAFLKEAGQESTKPIDKLTIKAKDLIGKEGEIVVLSS